MGTLCDPSKTLCPALKGFKLRYFYKHSYIERDWSQECCHGNNAVSVILFLNCDDISATKLNILVSVFYCSSELFSMSSLSKKENAILLYFEKPFK